MTKGATLVSVSDTPYYHWISRCVRRAFSCGEDRYSGKSFEHRREWFIERLSTLSKVFTIEVCAYALMNNHCHLVVHIDAEAIKALPMDDVIERWGLLYRGPEVIQRYLVGESLTTVEGEIVSTIAENWRRRLSDLSWFMRCLNELIARRANKEDKCTCRFWEGRFKSQALLDEQALIIAMAYVDLNPTRAGMAKDLADSDKTSVKERLLDVTQQTNSSTSVPLMPFAGVAATASIGLPFNLQDYLDLVDWTGRCVRDDKCGAIGSTAPRILRQLGISDNEWIPTVAIARPNERQFIARSLSTNVNKTILGRSSN